MVKTKKFLKAILPPIIVKAIQVLKRKASGAINWSGNYKTWDEVQKNCTGYDAEIILEKVKASLLKVKDGEAIYERDSVLFDKIEYSPSLLIGLQQAAIENNGNLCVLDFGGSLGSSYFQNIEFLKAMRNFKWCIVEQPHFVSCGKAYFEDEYLKFFYTIEECLATYSPQVLLLSSVLQYLEKPYEWLEKFLSLEIPFIILDRTAFIETKNDLLSLQQVSDKIYQASYPAWFFNFENIIRTISPKYKLIFEFKDVFTAELTVSGKTCFWKGLILKKINNVT